MAAATSANAFVASAQEAPPSTTAMMQQQWPMAVNGRMRGGVVRDLPNGVRRWRAWRWPGAPCARAWCRHPSFPAFRTPGDSTGRKHRPAHLPVEATSIWIFLLRLGFPTAHSSRAAFGCFAFCLADVEWNTLDGCLGDLRRKEKAPSRACLATGLMCGFQQSGDLRFGVVRLRKIPQKDFALTTREKNLFSTKTPPKSTKNGVLCEHVFFPMMIKLREWCPPLVREPAHPSARFLTLAPSSHSALKWTNRRTMA